MWPGLHLWGLVMKLDADALQRVGEALYGPNWQTPVAADLAVSDRTVRRWVAGHAIPDGVWADLALLCAKRGGALIQLGERLIR